MERKYTTFMIKNKTRKKILMQQSAVMKSYLQKSTGLMFHKKVTEAYIFPFRQERKIAIHMLCVFMPIDILFLNHQNKVVETAEAVKPFSFYLSKHNANTFIELPAGTISKTKTAIGDKIEY